MAPFPKLYFIMRISQITSEYKQLIILSLLIVVKGTLPLLSLLHLETLDPDCHFPDHESTLTTFCVVELTYS